jgi:hypothetical protein
MVSSPIDFTDERDRHSLLFPTDALYTVNLPSHGEVNRMKFTEVRSPINSSALTDTTPQQRHWIWWSLQHLGQYLLNSLKTEEVELQVWSTRDRTGRTWWSAVSNRTGKSIYNVSEDQIRQWIEKQQRS